jgi:hypothetical protein
MRKKRNFIPIVCAAGVLVFVVAFALRFLPSRSSASSVGQATGTASSTHQDPNPDVPPQEAAVASSVTGKVMVTRSGSSQVVAEGMQFLSGDAITVPTGGSLLIDWPNYGRTLVEGGTSVVVSQVFESTDQLRFLVRLTLSGPGSIWSRIGTALAPGSGFSVRSGNVLVTTPGSAFAVQRATDGVVRVASVGSYTDVFRVQDESPTEQDRQAGLNADSVERVLGASRELSPGTEVSLHDGATSTPAATSLSASDLTSDEAIFKSLKSVSSTQSGG